MILKLLLSTQMICMMFKKILMIFIMILMIWFYINIDKKCKILIVFDDMIADMINNKKLNSIVT